jgi:GAF domain-containing protein
MNREEDAILHNEARLQEIADLDLFNEEARAALEDLTRRAVERFNLPMSMVSIVLDGAQYFASDQGISHSWIGETHGTPVEWSFCQWAVKDREPFVVSDALANERMSHSPLVKLEGVRCYAGVPLITSRGHAIGAFCVTGTAPRSFTTEELEYLSQLAAEALERIERRVGRFSEQG